MKKQHRDLQERACAFTFVLLLLCGSVFAQSLSTAPTPSSNALPPILKGVTIEQRLDHQVPLDLQFRAENGAAVKLDTFFNGKPVILNLVYFKCPMLCTEVTNGMMKAMKVLQFTAGKEYNILTVSFDERETPDLALAKKNIYLQAYARQGAEQGWHFLTGDEDSIRKLTDAVGFRYKFDSQQNQFAHAATLVILTPQGKVSRYLYGVEFMPRDLRLALVEASQGKIGTAIDQALLLCFHYDPSTGKYSATVLNLIRAGGIVTLLALGTFIIAMRKKDQKANV